VRFEVLGLRVGGKEKLLVISMAFTLLLQGFLVAFTLLSINGNRFMVLILGILGKWLY